MHRKMKIHYEQAPSGTRQKALLLMKYLMLSLYVYYPHVRAGPIRMLEIGVSLVMDESGTWKLDLRNVSSCLLL